MQATAVAMGQRGPQFTLADVGRAAGVSAGAVAMRFGSKRGLLRAMRGVVRRDLVDRMRAEAQAQSEPARSVRAAAMVAVPGIADPEVTANHVALLGADLADPELRASLAELRADYRAEIQRLLAAADLPGAPPPDQAARMLAALVHGLQVDWALAPSGDMNDIITRDVDNLLTHWSSPG